jgi:hypothetical protein
MSAAICKIAPLIMRGKPVGGNSSQQVALKGQLSARTMVQG